MTASRSALALAAYAHPETERYSMTAPGDAIELVQDIGAAAHGGDPDLLPGVTRLETGWADADDHTSPLLKGLSSHSAVFDPDSTAHRNLRAVLVGGEISLANDMVERSNPYVSVPFTDIAWDRRTGYTLRADSPGYQTKTKVIP